MFRVYSVIGYIKAIFLRKALVSSSDTLLLHIFITSKPTAEHPCWFIVVLCWSLVGFYWSPVGFSWFLLVSGLSWLSSRAIWAAVDHQYFHGTKFLTVISLWSHRRNTMPCSRALRLQTEHKVTNDVLILICFLFVLVVIWQYYFVLHNFISTYVFW